MRGVDYNATHMVKAVKGLDLNPNAYTYVTVDGKQRRIADSNKDDSIDWFAAWAAAQIDALGTRPKVLLPIPSSKTIANSPETYRTFMLAEAIAKRVKSCTISSALRFVEARPSSREEGGSRDPKVLYPNMTLIKTLPVGQIVLIDDVMTSGGHLIASSWKLADKNRSPALALACGRSIDVQLDDPFSVPAEEVDIARQDDDEDIFG